VILAAGCDLTREFDFGRRTLQSIPYILCGKFAPDFAAFRGATLQIQSTETRKPAAEKWAQTTANWHRWHGNSFSGLPETELAR
jgi:hypothetical protein